MNKPNEPADGRPGEQQIFRVPVIQGALKDPLNATAGECDDVNTLIDVIRDESLGQFPPMVETLRGTTQSG